MGGLATVHLPAHHPLGILHRQAALGVGDEHDKDHQGQHTDDDHGDHPGGQGHGQLGLRLSGGVAGSGQGLLSHGAILHSGPDGHAADTVADHAGEAGHDARKQDDGNAVAHTELGDLLAQPHQEGGAGGEGQDDHQGDPNAIERGGLDQAVALDEGVVAEALEQGDGHGGIAGDGGDLLPALLAALLGQPLQSGDGHGQQLDDDGAVDIGLDGQGKDRGHGEGGAAHGVHQAQDGAALGLQVLLQSGGIDIGDRDCRAQTEDQQRKDGKEHLFAQLRHSPGIADGLDHGQTTSTLPPAASIFSLAEAEKAEA